MYHKRFLSYFNEWERRYYSLNLKLESYTPSNIINNANTVLLEAIDTSSKIDDAFNNLKKFINEKNRAFQKLNTDSRRKNADIILQSNSFDLGTKNLDNFTHEIFPYWKGTQYLTSVSIPQYSSITDKTIFNDEAGFKKKYFESILDSDNNFDKNKFRGSDKKIVVSTQSVPNIFKKCVNYIKDKDMIAIAIFKSNADLIKLLDSIDTTIPISESTLLDMSMFQLDYWDCLLETIFLEDADMEDSEIVSNNDPDNEIKPMDGVIESNNTENKEAEKTRSENDRLKDFVKWCYDFNTIKMSILDEGYDECIKFVSKVMR